MSRPPIWRPPLRKPGPPWNRWPKPFAPATARWDNAQFAEAFNAKRAVLRKTARGLDGRQRKVHRRAHRLTSSGALRQRSIICEGGMQFRRSDRTLADCGAHPLD